VVYLIVAYPAARLSDVIGRKRLLVLGYFCYGLVYLGFGLARGFGSYWLLFAIYGVYIGVTEGVEKALVSDIATVESRATVIGLHAALVGIGLLPASILAGIFWKVYGSSAPFYFGAVMGIAASIGLGVVLKEL
jgi:MFS family permease